MDLLFFAKVNPFYWFCTKKLFLQQSSIVIFVTKKHKNINMFFQTLINKIIFATRFKDTIQKEFFVL